MVEIAYHPDGSIAKVSATTMAQAKMVHRWAPELGQLKRQLEELVERERAHQAEKKKTNLALAGLAQQLLENKRQQKQEKQARRATVKAEAERLAEKLATRMTAELASEAKTQSAKAKELEKELADWRKVAEDKLEKPSPTFCRIALDRAEQAIKGYQKLQEERNALQAKLTALRDQALKIDFLQAEVEELRAANRNRYTATTS